MLRCPMRILDFAADEAEITRRLLKIAWLAPLLCCFAVAQQSANADFIAIVQGMKKAQTELQGHSSYQVIREYRLFGCEEFKG